MSNYNTDAKQGEQKELELANRFQNIGYTVTMSTKGIQVNWDLKLTNPRTNKTTALEVKYDRMSGETGRVAIEFEKRTTTGDVILSGVSNTEAEYLVYTFTNDTRGYLVSTAELMEKVGEAKRGYISNVWGGDGNRTRCMLLPLDEFKQMCTVI